MAVLLSGSRVRAQEVKAVMLLKGNLVTAKVEKAIEADGNVDATLLISEVHFGMHGLLGQSFTVSADKSGQGGIGAFSLVPPLRPGETGIWIVHLDDGRPVADADEQRLGYATLPARSGVAKTRFEAVRKWAGAVEEVAALDASGRLARLKQLCRDRTPEISGWGIHVVAGHGIADAREFFKSLIGAREIAVSSQVMLDEILSNDSEASWRDSDQRLGVLKRWVSSRQSSDDAARILSRLDAASQKKELETDVLLGLVRTAIENKQFPEAARRHGFWVLGRVAKEPAVSDEIFDYMANQIRGAKVRELRLGAAYALRNFVPLDDGRRAVVGDIAKKCDDAELTKILNEALERSDSAIPQ